MFFVTKKIWQDVMIKTMNALPLINFVKELIYSWIFPMLSL